MKNCKLSKRAGKQDMNGYHIIVECIHCGAKGVYHNQDENDLRADDNYNKEYGITVCTENSNKGIKKEKSLIQIRKGDAVKVENDKGVYFGIITFYPSNNNISIEVDDIGGKYTIVVPKNQITEVF